MKNKYNIGDILVGKTQEFFVAEITSRHLHYIMADDFVIIPTSIEYRLVGRNDDIVLSEQTIDDLFTKKEQN